MGRNHHINLVKKIITNTPDYWIKDAYNFVDVGHKSVIYYSEIRAAICFHQNFMDRIIHVSRYELTQYSQGIEPVYYTPQYTEKEFMYGEESIRWAKNKRKELSRALDKLDHYMQARVGGVGV